MSAMGVGVVETKHRGTPSSSETEIEAPPPPPPLRSRLLSEAAAEEDAKSGSDSTSSRDSSHGGSHPQKTLVIYSGPTSMDRLDGKNGMYIDNMNYFLEHGISCFDDDPESRGDADDDAESVIVKYAFVLTQEVADYYTAPSGPLTKKIQECKSMDKKVPVDGEESFIKVLTRLDRCYDMESIRIVVTNMNVQALYDNLLFINCGLVGPKIGPGSPRLIPSSSTLKTSSKQMMVPYSHWSQLYTSRLTKSVRLVGHSINTHFHTFFPHVQSFLYALRTDTVPILISSGAIYDCGLTQEELGGNPQKRFELINRYEVGMSTQLLKQGYNIATAFVNRYGFGKSLVYDKTSTWGTELDDTVSDIWYEDGIRNLTATMSKPAPKFWEALATTIDDKSSLRDVNTNNNNRADDTFEYHQWDILPWEYFIFFKVSRLVPEDVQREMNYNAEELKKSDVLVISNDPRRSPSEYWLRRSGVFVEPRNIRLDILMAGVFLVVCGLVLKRRRRIPVMNRTCDNNMMNGHLSPRRRMGLGLRWKHGHDHET